MDKEENFSNEVKFHFQSKSSSDGNRIAFVFAIEHGNNFEIVDAREIDSTDKSAPDVLAIEIVDACMKYAKNFVGVPEITSYVYNSSVRAVILKIGSKFGAVRFALRSELDKDTTAYIAINGTCDEMLPTVAPEDSAIFETPLVVATDGSINRFFAGGSFGWIAANGEFGYGAITTGESSLLCELVAIKEMLSSVDKRRELVVMVDNRLAIKMSTHAESQVGGKVITAKARRISNDIATLLSKRAKTEFRWVKSHIGHPLNEGADRLARNARLGSSFEQTADITKSIAKSIAEDVVASYADYDDVYLNR